MPNQITEEDIELLEDLGVDITPSPQAQRTAREERIISGFEEIERFFLETGRLPQHGDDQDIFERIYAVRLDRLRQSEECQAVLTPLDTHGLLNAVPADITLSESDDEDDEALLKSLGIDETLEDDITQLTHVRSRQEIKAAEEIAQRTTCPDFKKFKPIFEKVQQELKTGVRQTIKYQDNANVEAGDIFILDGQMVMVVEMGEQFISDYGKPDRRLRVVYSNGTESNLLLRSLQRALNKDKTSRRVTNPNLGPLFTNQDADDEDLPTGYIYVLRSQSDHPFIAQNRDVIHKIGVTGGDVKHRIANAKKDPTYLLAEVEIVTQFKLLNVNRKKLEGLLHKFFSQARLEMELLDRFGTPVQLREWFLVPLDVIEEVIEKIKDGTLDQFTYDPKAAKLTQITA
ncbi:GIY-YIG nuclease family protein [Synechococcus sp. PCC 6312]|uniref:GIY-YIG nuclease family protein n=1 Tax=Synechococcus sp. (strain ATCC 27167 / PCC 6312) TaxID=195253 RepID=UPI00029F0311|nr:GIY-YIG nuclease family protein [Synechococcus sp. PCC 6312]AFY61184.1 T5orf172 domain-containing protein [Synechococcus sp. PCC 6312]